MADKFNPDYVKNLPDAYNKKAGSNNAKILEIERYAASQLRESIAQIYESLDLDKAFGATLDFYGEMVGQKRGAATDEQYIRLIKARIARNLANGDHDSIVNALSLVFDCSPTEFQLVEKEDAVAVVVDGLPITTINRSGLTAEQAVLIICELIPAGVPVESITLEGTFEFSDSDTEYDAEKGFGNEEQTVGGFLGLLAADASSDLPI